MEVLQNLICVYNRSNLNDCFGLFFFHQAQILTKLIRSVDNNAGSPGKKKAEAE